MAALGDSMEEMQNLLRRQQEHYELQRRQSQLQRQEIIFQPTPLAANTAFATTYTYDELLSLTPYGDDKLGNRALVARDRAKKK